MYHVSPSTVSLNPIFPGHYPVTPAKTRPAEIRQEEDASLDDIAQDLDLGEHPTGLCEVGAVQGTYECVCTQPNLPRLSFIGKQNEENLVPYIDEDLPENPRDVSPRAISPSSTCSLSSVEPRSVHESVDEDAETSSSDASTINRLRPFARVHGASSTHIRISDLPSIRSEVSTTFGVTDRVVVPPRNGTQCPSSISLELELVGLPPINRTRNANQGVFLDGESLRYFGVDLSCLSQPDGQNAWTLALGAGSPFPSSSTSEETPQSGISSTFSSPDASAISTHEVSSTGSSPSLSLDYYGLESTLPTPANITRTPLADVDELDEPSPPYEPREMVPESPPRLQDDPIVIGEPRSHFKEVFSDVKKFGSKLKKIWKTRTPFGFSRTSKAKTSSDPPSFIYTEAIDIQTTFDTIPNEYGLRSPPGLSELENYVDEQASVTLDRRSSPKTTEGRKKMLLKGKTSAEIKHIRRRTLPAGPLGEPPQGSPIIAISNYRPRPRSLIFAASPDTDTSISSPRFPQSEHGRLQLPESVNPPTPRNRKRWSTLAFFTRS